MKSFALILALAAVAEPALSKDVPVNAWVLVEDVDDGKKKGNFWSKRKVANQKG